MATQTIYDYAHKGDFEYVRSKLEENPSLLTQPDSNKRLLIHWASLGGNFKLVSHLVDLGTPIDPCDDTDTTPLILSSSAGHIEISNLLISKGANTNHKNSNGHTALQYAASKGWLQICVKLLEKGADINVTDNRGATPLHRAASKGNLSIVKLLVSYKDSLKINQKDVYGNTALHLACEEDRQDEALILVENGADVETKNKDKQSPLDLCSPKLLRLIKNKLETKQEGTV